MVALDEDVGEFDELYSLLTSFFCYRFRFFFALFGAFGVGANGENGE